MRLGALISAWMLACLVWVAPANAQQDAREAFRKGEAAYSVGNYELAIKEWSRAYSIDPRPRIQFNLAQAYERLGRWPEAVEALKLFLENADPDDPTYADANARLSSLQQRLSLTGLILEGGLDGGVIKVDDKEWGRTPRPDKIPVMPGPHTVVVDWGDRPPFQASIVVPPGQVIRLNVVTPEASPGAGDPEPAVTPTGGSVRVDSGSGNGLSNGLFIGAGASGALAIGSLIYFFNRNSELDRVAKCGSEFACTDAQVDAIAINAGELDPSNNEALERLRDQVGSTTDLVDTTDKIDKQRTLAIAGTALFGAAAVGLAVTGFLTRDRGDTDQRATRCAVGLTGGMCQVSF